MTDSKCPECGEECACEGECDCEGKCCKCCEKRSAACTEEV